MSVEGRESLLKWAVDSWHAEVANRPLINVHRRSLDGTWRQVIRRLGGDDVSLIGPSHDALMADEPKRNGRPISWPPDELESLRAALGKLAEKWEAIEPNASNTVTHATVQACANQIRTLLAQPAAGTPTTEGET